MKRYGLEFDSFCNLEEMSEKYHQSYKKNVLSLKITNGEIGELLESFAIMITERMKSGINKFRLILEKEKPDLVFLDMFMQGFIEEVKKREINNVILHPGVLGVTGFEDKPYFPDFFSYPSDFENSLHFFSRFSKFFNFYFKNFFYIVKSLLLIERTRYSLNLDLQFGFFANMDQSLVIVPDYIFSYPRRLPPNVKIKFNKKMEIKKNKNKKKKKQKKI